MLPVLSKRLEGLRKRLVKGTKLKQPDKRNEKENRKQGECNLNHGPLEH